MRRIINFIEGNWKTFTRFSVTGLGGIATNLSIFYFTVDYLGYNAFLFSIICYFLAATQNYIVNFYWTFATTKKSFKPSIIGLLKFYLGAFLGLVVNLAILLTTNQLFSIATVSQILGLFSGVFVNFLTAKHFIFEEKN
ncbi:GtrA family protein [Vibrio cholerae]|uniref:GtrA family protein n=1 Tax=Vibrio cholerae TaxID=666 RepID=UPI000C7F5AC2|nr:GtrA family protein [Vibrio cholerae]PKQ51806.1 hypothetical protein CR151_18815 [Vibrio cholerae]TXY76823.1 GtrA family protein [Vibrio cholerae]BCN16764.1 hypothetical protein [Vibrio cholerae]GHX13711.1 hypothetical protein VCSRO106_2919 [Vibrio cholerae]